VNAPEDSLDPAPSDAPADPPPAVVVDEGGPVGLSRVVRLWFPLAASWLLMSAELPLLAMVVSRLPDPKIHLAAYGSVVFPISLVVEGPIIMLLAAATALCSHGQAYRLVWKFMHTAGFVLTAVHVAIAFTPLYDVVVRDIMGAPDSIHEPARIGLQIMTPWTWSIAYRRFHQGVMIACERSREVGYGTLVRLVANVGALLTGYAMGWPGIIVGATAISTGVITEAVYVGWRVRPLLRERVLPAHGEHLTFRAFLRFYVPLAMTPLITLFIQPLGAAAMNRMPRALDSVAAWPALHGLLFITRSVGMAYNEVVVSLANLRGAVASLRRFNLILAGSTMGVLALLAFTPLAGMWFERITGLPPELAELCRWSAALGLLMPGYAVLQSWYQGVLVKSHYTRPITEAVALYFVISASMLGIGIWLGHLTGIYWAMISFSTAGVLQTTWLWSRDAA
jgi:hypothetical protein